MALFNRFYDRFPNTDFSQINLDWIIEKLAKHEIQIQELFSQDIPTEVQNVLNEWLEDGTLADLINDDLLNSIFLQLQQDIADGDTALRLAKTWKCSTFADIQNIGADLQAGDTVTTAGFYTIADGGGACYAISTNTDGIDVGGGLSLYAFPLSVKARAWGIHGDGSNETAAVLRALKRSARELDIENMSIVVDGILPLRNGFTLRGNGGTFVEKNGSSLVSNSYMFNAGGLDDVTIDGINFDRGTQTVDFYAINANLAERVVIKNCTFTGGLGYCIRISKAEGVLIENCSIHDVTGISGNPGGLIYMQGGHDLTVRKVIADTIQDHVVYLDGSQETYSIFIDDMRCNNVGVGALTNAAIVAVYGNVHEVTIIGVVGRSVKTGIGFFVRNSQNPSNYTVEACDIEATVDCIEVIGEAATIGHHANANINNCTLTASTQDAIHTRFESYIWIRNNFIKGASRYGVGVTGAEYVFVSNNMVSGCATAISIGARDTEEGVTSNFVAVTNNGILVNESYGLLCNATVTRFYDFLNLVTGTQSDPAKNFVIAGGAFDIGVPVSGSNQLRSIMWSASIPTLGHHYTGDICLDSTGATDGWKCTTSGTPGTWVAR